MKKILFLSLATLFSESISVYTSGNLAIPRTTSSLLPCVHSNKSFDIIYDGFAKLDWFYDSRQAFTDSDGDTAILPKPRNFDVMCNDINSKGAFNIVSLETRLRTDITGPKVFDARSGAVIEAEFGGRGAVRQRFSLRHGYMTLDWKRWFLLIGQYWHPTYRIECAPAPLATDGGAPFEAVIRDPQVSVAYRFKYVALMGTVISQLSSVNNGPDQPLGFSNVYFRNSLMPNFHFHVEGALADHIVGAGIGVKRLVPRILSNNNFKVSESLISVDGHVYASLRFSSVTLNMKINAGQNTTNLKMLSGYAVSRVNPCTDEREYANLNTVSFWSELVYTHPRVEPALFLGYTKNLGSTKPILLSINRPDGSIEKTIYTLIDDVDDAFRFGPRLRIFFEPVTFGIEVELTRGSFGTTTTMGTVINTHTVNNIHVQASAMYRF